MEDLLNRTYKTEGEKKYTILYVDDEEVNLRVFNRNFSKFYHVFTAIDAFEAQNILAQNKVDLIMTDQCMPRMNGSELLIKIVPLYPDIIRMIMTGFSDENDISEVKEKVGLHNFLKKPWDPAKLREEFDRALDLREDGLAQKRSRKNRTPKTNQKESELDLLESTISLVESTETKKLKNEINELVKESKNKKSEFMDGGMNYLLNLKDSIMPIQQELKLYTESSFIVFDRKKLNQNGYWFGEENDCLIVASFYSNTHTRESLALNAFVGTMLTEIVFKEGCTVPHEIIEKLSRRVHVRFLGLNNENANSCPLEIAVISYNKETDQVNHSGAYHNVYFLNDHNEFKVLNSNHEVMIPGVELEYDINSIDAENINGLYMVPFNVIEETNEGSADPNTLKMLINEMKKVPFGMQAKMFSQYGYRSVIALKF